MLERKREAECSTFEGSGKQVVGGSLVCSPFHPLLPYLITGLSPGLTSASEPRGDDCTSAAGSEFRSRIKPREGEREEELEDQWPGERDHREQRDTIFMTMLRVTSEPRCSIEPAFRGELASDRYRIRKYLSLDFPRSVRCVFMHL